MIPQSGWVFRFTGTSLVIGDAEISFQQKICLPVVYDVLYLSRLVMMHFIVQCSCFSSSFLLFIVRFFDNSIC